MNPLRAIKQRLKNTIARIARVEARRAFDDLLPLIPQLIEFQNSPPEQRQSHYDLTKDPVANFDRFSQLGHRLRGLGIPVEDSLIDIDDFSRWIEEFAELKAFYGGLQPPLIEKCLEHYLVHRHLRIAPGEIYIDIAASSSPWARLLRQRGVEAYRLDMDYAPGVHGIDIGADASRTGLPDGFATILSAQCAYNCFMGDADTRFLKEAARILRPGGRWAVTPLIVDETHLVTRSPYMIVKDFQTDPGAQCVWRDDEHRVHFSRHYSPEAFAQRVYSKLPPGMNGRVLFFRNLPDLMKRFPGQRIYGYFMFLCAKD